MMLMSGRKMTATGMTTTDCDHAFEMPGDQDSAASMIFSSPSLTALTTAA